MKLRTSRLANYKKRWDCLREFIEIQKQESEDAQSDWLLTSGQDCYGYNSCGMAVGIFTEILEEMDTVDEAAHN